jgi:hypothetical protein
MDSIKADNTRLKEENAALIRVISKLSKWSNENISFFFISACALACFFLSLSRLVVQ